uniref:Diacylglycerol kinase n=3 Tax=Cacopsylla melanoneura TaxID=428564 RepID=A0A8D8LY56_9HEMI
MLQLEDLQFVWPVFLAFSLLLVSKHLYQKFYQRDHLPKGTLGNHNWTRITDVSKVCQCSVCEMLLMNNLNEYYCDCCGVCADLKCIPGANANIKCKQISVTQDKQTAMKHLWTKGYMLLETSLCDVCEEECDVPNQIDFQCAWCLRTVHTDCKPKIAEVCDFGPYKKFVIPPNCVTLETKRAGVRFRKSHVITIHDPGWTPWTPLIVLGNRKSGNGDGSHVLSTFRRLLNPLQVVDLADKSPEEALHWVTLVPSRGQSLILAAGGDGTAAWILNTIHSMKMDPAPSVGIIPLGTGNDLSRVLGWGKLFNKDSCSAFQILDSLTRSQVAHLDRWSVQIKSIRQLRLTRAIKSKWMYNYLSIGVDAQVALDFHNTRESSLYICSSRAFNKFLYLTFGTQQAMERLCKDLEQRIELYLDGTRVNLPPIESVVVLNIPSWAAGVDLWKLGRDSEDGTSCSEDQKMDDAKIEVMALYSSFHIARLQVGLSEPLKLGQASQVKIKLLNKTPMQIDGEPWLQPPAMIILSHVDKANVLMLSTETE